MNDQQTKAIEIRRETQDRLLPELIVKLLGQGFSEQMVDDQVDIARNLIDQQLWMNQSTYMESLTNQDEPKA